MAAAAGHRINGVLAGKVFAADKENVSPQQAKLHRKLKGLSNTNGPLYGTQHERQQKRAVQERRVLSPKFAGVSKTSHGDRGYFASLLKPGHPQTRSRTAGSPMSVDALLNVAQGQKVQPVGLGFGLAEVVEPYIENTTNQFASKLEDYRKQLDAARQGIDHVTGQPVDKPDVPTKQDFDELTKQLEQLNRPFEHDQVTLLFEDPHDPARSISQLIRVGDIKDNCMKRYERRMAKFTKLEQQHVAISEEMAQLKQEIIEDASNNNRATRDFEQHMNAFEEEKAQINAQAEAEREDLKEELRKVSAVLNKKIKQLFELL